VHRLTKIGTVLVFMMAIAGVSAGIVAAQSGEEATATPGTSVATATAEELGTPTDGATPDGQDATPEGERSDDGHLCPDKEGAEESTTATTA